MALYDEEYGYQQSNVESGSFVSCIPEINEKYMTNEHMKQYYTIAEETSKTVPTHLLREVNWQMHFIQRLKMCSPVLALLYRELFHRVL